MTILLQIILMVDFVYQIITVAFYCVEVTILKSMETLTTGGKLEQALEKLVDFGMDNTDISHHTFHS
ncbi:hypothetical protein HMPREF9446_02097 [Bacteroides fluxus YIT 12057]|uniref:Uncharacterized protein n=1 Tax=Bacteroides fluxus YIT 12057 TaxID=763034 RepID=F3PTM9_9BACE|nr:hypothetical protein HMPREF9446_02097 [Bacteroides fluxus YIT 12057]